MIANFFKETKPINFLVLTIFSLIVYFVSLFFQFKIDASVNLTSGVLNFIVFILLLFIHDFIVRKNFLTQNNSYALLIFILLFAFFPSTLFNSKILISNFLLFFAFRRIYSLRTALDTKEKLFDSGFWIAIAFLFFNWSIFFLLLVYAAILIFRKTKWNHYFIPLVGYLTPILIYFTILLLLGKDSTFASHFNFESNFDFHLYNNIILLLPSSIVLVFILWSIYPTLKNSLNAKKDFKTTFNLLVSHLIIAIIIAVLSPVKNGSELLFIFFPFSVLLSNYLQIVKEYWFKESILILFISIFLVISFLH